MIKIIPDREGFLTQWDSNRKVRITGLDGISDAEVHFASPNDTAGAYVVLPVVEDGAAVATIPNILLTVPGRIDVFVYRDDHTCVRGALAVAPREKPEDYVYTETEVLRFKLKENLSNKVSEITEDNTDDMHYPSTGAVKKALPTKLSDLENDLFYDKKVEVLSLTASDFQRIADDSDLAVYQHSPGLAWMANSKNFDFTVTYVINGEKITCAKGNFDKDYENHADGVDEITFSITNDADEILVEFVLVNGADTSTSEPADMFTMIVYIGKVDSIVFQADAGKKIASNNIDTSEIESRISKLEQQIGSTAALVDGINGEVI